jgi:glyoxylase-like metal-dependent hydrolase (beta-lactamase superfamily II)
MAFSMERAPAGRPGRPARRRARLVGAALGLAALGVAASGCDARRFVMGQIASQTEAYFHPPGSEGWDVTRLTEHVYTFRWGWYRNIFVVTPEGVFATDPFNREAAASLRDVIAEASGGRPVRILFYSHYHRDHTEGGALLEPEQVWCHERCPSYFRDLGRPEILPPTRTVSGDETLTLGGVEIRLLYLGKSHTDTLYAVHVPGEELLWTADFGLVRTIPPMGVPDFYRPGLLAGMERLSRLEFRVFVPSHFGYGTKQDFVDFYHMMRDLGTWVREAQERYGPPSKDLDQGFRYVYDRMKAGYGDWHGFDQMILFTIARANVGEMLGY